MILIENKTNINSFFSKLESKIGSIEGKLIKVSGKLLTLNETRFIEISDELESVLSQEVHKITVDIRINNLKFH